MQNLRNGLYSVYSCEVHEIFVVQCKLEYADMDWLAEVLILFMLAL